ncbi:MAG: GspE/PulE family protein [Acidobacteriota bacterium]
MRLGEILLAKNQISTEDLEKALELQRERGEKIGKILVDLGFIAQRDVLAALSEQLQLPLVSIEGAPFTAPELQGLSPRFLRQSRCLPIGMNEAGLTLAMADPLDFETIAAVRGFTGIRVLPVLAAEAELLEAIDKHYGESAARQEPGDEFGNEEGKADLEQLRDMASEAPVILTVTANIATAVEKRPSDIHIEPYEKTFRVRFRIDGVLYEQETPPKEMKFALISRLKLMARLNIAERRLPQDGRIKVKTLGREVDLRVSTLPTLYGESVVMRLLDRSAGDNFYDLRKLGFSQQMLDRMEFYTGLPHGIMFVTGPTGSGKSTTLYSALKRINGSERKIITIEDPVEYQMDGINQIHVNNQIGLTFASGLRHIMRQDPDVIMVGEVRDRETADVAIRSALTGHFVFSTLHTNDAPSAVTRLVDMGVENYLISSSVVSVLAQRLVRRICPQCRTLHGTAMRPEGYEVECYRGRGCDACNGSGYAGRVGIFELMEMNDDIRKHIMANEDSIAITATARRHGMRTLREDGWDKVEHGVTTPDELLRVTQDF